MPRNARFTGASADASTSQPPSSSSRAKPSEVAPSFEGRRRLWPRQLIDGDTLAAGRMEGADRPMGNFEGRLSFPTALAQAADFLAQVRDAEDKDGRIPLDMVREEQQWRRWCQLDGRHPRAHAGDGKSETAAQHVDEIGHIPLDVAARVIDEVQRFERHATSPPRSRCGPRSPRT